MLELTEVLKSCGILTTPLDPRDSRPRRIRKALENVTGTVSARRRAMALMPGMLCANEASGSR